MLVDSGAASTFLNWKGVTEGLGLQRNSKALTKQPSPMGAIGSDDIAMDLSHRIHVSSNLNLAPKGSSSNLPGLNLTDRRLGVDVGNIAILDSLEPYGVGGILGIDVLMRCSKVKMSFDSTSRRLTLFQ